ncbi:hypothetical protein MITS9509_02443 [Synechococcus sp. MIT S9509]|nr:hypothetical protein MITS9509_02443 [Synechococcus sp. MIT S9509]
MGISCSADTILPGLVRQSSNGGIARETEPKADHEHNDSALNNRSRIIDYIKELVKKNLHYWQNSYACQDNYSGIFDHLYHTQSCRQNTDRLPHTWNQNNQLEMSTYLLMMFEQSLFGRARSGGNEPR